MKHLRTAGLGDDAEINEAIAILVLAFAADPVARWMYRAPLGDQLRALRGRQVAALGRDVSTQVSATKPSKRCRNDAHNRHAPSRQGRFVSRLGYCTADRECDEPPLVGA